MATSSSSPAPADASAGAARLAVLAGVASISFAAPLFRAAAPTHPLVAAGARLALAALLLAPLAARGWRRMPRAQRRDAALGGVLYAAHFGTWVSSLTLTTVAASVTLVTATPILLATVAFLTGRDRPTRRQLTGIALGLVGVALIGGFDFAREGALLGDALAFAGAAAMAGYLWLVRRHGRVDVAAFTGVACAIGGALLLGAAVLLGVPLAFPSVDAALFIALAALLPQLVGHSALTWALRHLSPTLVGMATVAEPVGATLLAWTWLDETPPPLTLLGCAITLAAVLLSFRRR